MIILIYVCVVLNNDTLLFNMIIYNIQMNLNFKISVLDLNSQKYCYTFNTKSVKRCKFKYNIPSPRSVNILCLYN